MVEESKTCSLDGVWDIIGRKSSNCHKQNIQLEVKQDKYEQRVLVGTEHRICIFKAKLLKQEFSIHYADVTNIRCHDATKLSISTDNRQIRMIASVGETFNNLLLKIFEFFAIVNHSVPLDKRIPKLDIMSPMKEALLGSLCLPESLPHLMSPCGNFSTVYRSKCDQMGLDCHEDVAWDVDAIYNSHNCFELNLSDFDHLTPKHLIPILASLEHNRWFTKLNLSNLKLTTDIQNELLRMFKENDTIEEINLTNTGIKAEYASKLFSILSSVQCCEVSRVDLSCNNLEDKGISHLCHFITNKQGGMKSLNLSKTSLTSAGVNALARVLTSKQANLTTLSYLDVSGNSLKEELVALQNFLAQPNNLMQLRLSDTETPIDNFFAACLRGCTQHLEVLDLSGCQLASSTKKGASVPITWKQFFSSASSLRLINFSNCRFPPDAFKSVFEGLTENTVLADVEVNFSGCQVGLSPAAIQIFEQNVGTMTSVSSLDLSDNGFDQALNGILCKLVQNKHLKKLCLGRNLINVKTKFLHQLMDNFVAIIQEEDSVLESLSLDNMKLKGDLMILINALGTNASLSHLDISGNMIGDFGAKMLSKALLINRKLNSIVLDNNQFTHVGLEHIAASLERNSTLKALPLPVNDIVAALKISTDRTEKALKKIGHCISHNSSDKTSTNFESAFKLQQWIFNSFDQEAFNRNIFDLSREIANIQTTVSTGVKLDLFVEEKLKSCEGIVQEAKNVKNVMSELHKICLGFQKGQVICDFSQTFVEKMKECMQSLTTYINSNYSHSLKAFRRQSRYDPNLTSREEAALEKEFQSALQSFVSSLFGSVFFEKSLKCTEFMLPCVALSLELALVNAKNISSKLAATKSGPSGEVGPCTPTEDTIQGTPDDNIAQSSEEGKRSNSWKNKIRPSSSIVAPSSQNSSQASSTGPSAIRLSLDPFAELKQSVTPAPVPKPRTKKRRTENLGSASERSDDEGDVGEKLRSGPTKAQDVGLDIDVPPATMFEGHKTPEDEKALNLPVVFPKVEFSSDVSRRQFLGNLTKSISHDDLDEVERCGKNKMLGKKSLSRDALEDMNLQTSAAPNLFGSGVDKNSRVKNVDLDADETVAVDVKLRKTSNTTTSDLPPIVSDLGTTPKLTHLCKDRPKRLKTKAPTRPAMRFEEESMEEVDERDGVAAGNEKESASDRNSSEMVDSSEGVAADVSDEGVGRKVKKGGIAGGLKNLFLKKSPSYDLSPTVCEQKPSLTKSLDEATTANETAPKQLAVKQTASKEPGFINELPGALKKKVFEESAATSSDASSGKSTSKNIPTRQAPTLAQTPSSGDGTSAPVAVKRLLPPGARPGLGGFAMPSANEIQQKRLSMRPISAENPGQTEVAEDKKPSGLSGNSDTDPQLSKVKPPPPLAPKPAKNLRNSKRDSISAGEQGLIEEEKNAKDGDKSKAADDEPVKPATFMEEFKRKQEKNKAADFSKM